MGYISLFIFLFFRVALAWESGFEEKNGNVLGRYYRTAVPQNGVGNVRNGPQKMKSFGNQPRLGNDGNPLRNYYLPPTPFDPAIMGSRQSGVYDPPIITTILGHIFDPAMTHMFDSPAMPHMFDSPAMPHMFDSPAMPHIFDPTAMSHMFDPTAIPHMYTPPGLGQMYETPAHPPSGPAPMLGPSGLGHMVPPPIMGHMYDPPIPGSMHDPSGMPHLYNTPGMGHVFEPMHDPALMDHMFRPPAGNLYEPPMMGHLFDPSLLGALHDPQHAIHPGNKPVSYGPPMPGHPYEQPGYVYPTPRLAHFVGTGPESPNSIAMFSPGMMAGAHESEHTGAATAGGYFPQPPVTNQLHPQSLMPDIFSQPPMGNPQEPIMIGAGFDHQAQAGINNLPQVIPQAMQHVIPQGDSMNTQTGQPQPFVQAECQCSNPKSAAPAPLQNTQELRQMANLVKLVRVLMGGHHRGSEGDAPQENQSKEEPCNFRSMAMENGDGPSEEIPELRKKPIRRLMPFLRDH